MYKIVSKVLSIRLRTVMNKIISNSEGVSIQGYQITDGILVANKCVDSWHKMGRQGIVCKLDMEKAYDRVDWEFLFWVLKKGFSERWISWMRGCVEHPWFLVLLNGTSKIFFSCF